MQAKELLLFLSLKYRGDWDKIYEAIKAKEKVNEDDFKKLIGSFKGDYITLIDDNYPSFFKNSNKPPFVLFYKGDLSLLTLKREKYLSVVGSREASDYGKDSIYDLITKLPEDIIIVSGLAKGIDVVSHKAALNTKKRTIAILGGGIDNIYPRENKEIYNAILESNNLILSEYPENDSPKPENFLFRNRLIAIIGKALLVGESYERSGTNSTVCFALNEGRDVGCLPYRINEHSNCNKYIKEGAYLIENEKDILSMLCGQA